MVSIGFYLLCLSPHAAKDWSQKLINPFVSEATESACIIIVVIDIIMAIQHIKNYVNSSIQRLEKYMKKGQKKTNCCGQ